MANETERTVIAEGREIHYCLERKDVKNLNLRVKKDGCVFVSANTFVPCDEVDAFICDKATYILAAIDRFYEMSKYAVRPKQYVSGETFYIQGRGLRLVVSQSAKDSIFSDGIHIHLEVKDISDIEKKQRIVKKFLDQQCKIIFQEVVDDLYPLVQKYNVDKPLLKARTMEMRWGSCQPKAGIITLNKRLLEAPRNCIEYVIMHELCHLIHPNHSKQFYSWLTMLMPDWKERKQLLEKNAVHWL